MKLYYHCSIHADKCLIMQTSDYYYPFTWFHNNTKKIIEFLDDHIECIEIGAVGVTKADGQEEA